VEVSHAAGDVHGLVGLAFLGESPGALYLAADVALAGTEAPDAIVGFSSSGSSPPAWQQPAARQDGRGSRQLGGTILGGHTQITQIGLASALIGTAPTAAQSGGSGAAVAPWAIAFRDRAGRLRGVRHSRKWADSNEPLPPDEPDEVPCQRHPKTDHRAATEF
jgi:hypothetical protein